MSEIISSVDDKEVENTIVENEAGYKEEEEEGFEKLVVEFKEKTEPKENTGMGNEDYVELIRLREEVKNLRTLNDSMRENDSKLKHEIQGLQAALKNRDFEILKLSERANENTESEKSIAKIEKLSYMRTSTLLSVLIDARTELAIYQKKFGTYEISVNFDKRID